MSRAPIRVLHVDDHPEFGDLTATFLERENDRLSVETATSAAEGIELIRDVSPDCVVSDYDMPGQDGIEFLREVRENHPELPFVLFTGKGSEEVASEAISAGVTDYLQKGSGTEQYELLANRITNAVRARQSAERLNRQEELLRLTEETADIGGWELDLETDELQITPGAGRLTGLSPDDDLSPDGTIDLYHPDDRPEVRAALDRAAETGEEVRGTWRIQPPEGGERTVDVTITPVSSDGAVTKLRGAIHDITERQERRQELEQAETLFQHKQGPLFLVDVGEEFTFRRVNPEFEDATGLSADRVQGQTPRELFGDDQGGEIEQRYRECVERGEPIEYEEQRQFGDGLTYWETRIAPVVIDGDVGYIAGSTRDVTHTRERQRELQLLQQAIDDADVPIALADPSEEDNPLVYVNDAYQELTGYSEENALGRNCRYLQGEDTDPEKASALREAIDDEEPITVELRNYRKDGTEFWNRLTVTPIYDDDDHLVRYLGTQQDVTERKERERELRAEREFTEQALDTLDDLFYVFDTDGTIQRYNEQAVEVTGYDPAELDGIAATELFPEDEQQTIADAVETTFRNGEATAVADLLTADGERIPYEFTGARLADVDGNTTGLVGIGRDLTGRRRRERRFQTLVEESKDIVTVVDTDGQIQYQSPSVERVLGYDPHETIGDTAWAYFHPDDRADLIEMFERGAANPDTNPVTEFRIRHADGSWRWMEARGNNQLDNPAVEGYVVNSRDITARRERERELREVTSQYRALIDNFPNGGVFLFDEDLRNVRAGGDELEKVGLSSDEIKGTKPHDLFPEEIADEHVHYFERTLAGENHTYQQEYRGMHYEIRTMPIRDDSGEVVYGLAVSRNITEQVERERELERQKDRSEEFASVVSHDLRNPLNIAEGRLGLAQAECDSPHLDDVAGALDRMDALIEDLLTLARGGEAVGSAESVSLPALAEECWGVVPEENATLTVETDRTVSADRSRLEQLLENLFANAVEHGGEDVTVRVDGLTDGFSVADDGVGIPEGAREDVFDPGYSTAEEGTGFGLRITKQIADAHGWDIRVTDSDDGGARFEVTGVDILE